MCAVVVYALVVVAWGGCCDFLGCSGKREKTKTVPR